MSVSEQQQLPLDLDSLCQRWTHRQHSWLPTSAGGFDPSCYRVREMSDEAAKAAAKAFVVTHHYSGSWPVIYSCQVTAQVGALSGSQSR